MRPIVAQTFNPIPVLVGVAPTPFSAVQLNQAYIDTILICLPSTAANSVFYGNGGVTITTGNEITTGVTISLEINNDTPRYELQDPLVKIARKIECDNQAPYEIPFIYWDLTNLFFIAAAPTTVILTALQRAWV